MVSLEKHEIMTIFLVLKNNLIQCDLLTLCYTLIHCLRYLLLCLTNNDVHKLFWFLSLLFSVPRDSCVFIAIIILFRRNTPFWSILRRVCFVSIEIGLFLKNESLKWLYNGNLRTSSFKGRYRLNNTNRYSVDKIYWKKKYKDFLIKVESKMDIWLEIEKLNEHLFGNYFLFALKIFLFFIKCVLCVREKDLLLVFAAFSSFWITISIGFALIAITIFTFNGKFIITLLAEKILAKWPWFSMRVRMLDA